MHCNEERPNEENSVRGWKQVSHPATMRHEQICRKEGISTDDINRRRIESIAEGASSYLAVTLGKYQNLAHKFPVPPFLGMIWANMLHIGRPGVTIVEMVPFSLGAKTASGCRGLAI